MKTSAIEYQYNIVDILSKSKNYLKPSKQLEFLRENIKNVSNCNQNYNIKADEKSVKKEEMILEINKKIDLKNQIVEKIKNELSKLIEDKKNKLVDLTRTEELIEKNRVYLQHIENSNIKYGISSSVITENNKILNSKKSELESLNKDISEHQELIKKTKKEIIQESKNLNKIRVEPESNRATIEFIYNIECKPVMNLNSEKSLVDKNSIEKIVKLYRKNSSSDVMDNIKLKLYTDFLKNK